LTKTVLGEFGYRVIEAVDGEEAASKFRENRDDIKLVILDVVMPKKNGKEARDLIASLDPAVKILFLSATAPMSSARRASTPVPKTSS